MKYIKMLGFYLCEFLSSMVNMLCAFFGYYPSLELGVYYLTLLESKRVIQETLVRQVKRSKNEQRAKDLEEEATDGHGEDL